MTLVEVLVATLILSVAAAGLLGAFDAARDTTSYTEKHNVATALAEREIERITALPWKAIANYEAEPPASESSSSTNPSFYVKSGECQLGKVLPSHTHCYQYDWSNTSDVEPLVLAPKVELEKGKEGEENIKDPRSFETKTASGTTRLSGEIYHYVTWVYDPNCTATGCTSESAESSSNYKRITVGVTVAGMKQPVELSTLYANPEGKYANPLVDGATCKEGGTSVKCTN